LQNRVTNRNTALHMALNEGNHVSVDIILSALAKAENNSSHNYRDMLNKLIGQSNFVDYLDNFLVKTD